MNLTKRQKEILDFIRSYRAEHGISPTQREIRETLQALLLRHRPEAPEAAGGKGRPRARVEPQPRHRSEGGGSGLARRALLGLVAAGRPIEPFPQEESIEVPSSLLGKGEHFVLRVRGESMIDDGILDGDFVVVSRREKAESGQTVVALVRGEATLKRYYTRGSPGPASAGQRGHETADLRRPGRDDPGRGHRASSVTTRTGPADPAGPRAAVEFGLDAATYPSG